MTRQVSVRGGRVAAAHLCMWVKACGGVHICAALRYPLGASSAMLPSAAAISLLTTPLARKRGYVYGRG